MSATKNTSFRWPEEFLDRIDAVRGDVPRSMWIRRLVERELHAYPEPDPEQAPNGHPPKEHQ